jgi:hypothetical protein
MNSQQSSTPLSMDFASEMGLPMSLGCEPPVQVSETVRDLLEQMQQFVCNFQQSMVISDIHSLPPSQMFESPLKHQDPRTVSLEEELKMKLSEANRIMQQNNKIITTYEGLVSELKEVLHNKEELLVQHKLEISRMSKPSPFAKKVCF